MLHYNYPKLIASAILVWASMSFFSCSETEQGTPTESLITLQVKMPENASGNSLEKKTRAGTEVDGDADENKITKLKFFIYEQSPAKLEVYKEITLNEDGHSEDPMWDKGAGALRITVTPGDKRIYCIANWQDNAAKGMPAINDENGNNATYQTLLNNIRQHEDISMYDLDAMPIVMTGEVVRTINASDQDVDIQLIRQIAKVEVHAKLASSISGFNPQVKIKGIKFKRIPKQSYLFPKSSSPAAVTVWHQTEYTGPLSKDLTATAQRYDYRYYIPEYYAAATTVTQMYINAEYNERNMYYRIDLCAPGSNPQPAHNQYTIERNHIYKYTISIQGEGSTTEAGAAVARSADNNPGVANITYELEVK